MSAFTVSAAHVNALVAAASRAGIVARFDFTPEEAKRVGQVGAETVLGEALWAENYRSVNARYGEADEAPAYTYNPRTARQLTPVELLKAINCYNYQSCEHAEWRGGRVERFMDSLTNVTISKLPGYSEAPWAI